MSTQTPVYWPFAVLPPEQQTAQHRQEIAFLEEAYRDGLRPCKFTDGEYRIESANGRSAWVIARGRRGVVRRWELWLNDGQERVSTTWVDGFEAAAAIVLKWTDGVRSRGDERGSPFAHVTVPVGGSDV
jgi:hypothetical protein